MRVVVENAKPKLRNVVSFIYFIVDIRINLLSKI